MTYSKLRTAALEPVAGIPALYPKYVWQAQGLPLLARQSQRYSVRTDAEQTAKALQGFKRDTGSTTLNSTQVIRRHAKHF